jgi:glucose-6-phosphate 1-epimerase
VDSQRVAPLAERFRIPGAAEIVSGNGGLTKVVISAPEATGEMYLHGAHVTSWVPPGQAEVLYLSPNSLFQDGRAIRGGVPICFPWFGDKQGDPAAPAHGFVRTKSWELTAIERVGQGIAVTMSAASDEASRKRWPFDFRITCRATFSRELKLELIVTNTGTSGFTFEEALHVYFAVENAESAFVRGLDAVRYLDKTDNRREKMQSDDVHFEAETDRVYLDTEQALQLFDPVGKRRVGIEKQNSRTTVVWNPWVQKSIELKDLGADQWKRFVCVETTNVSPFAVQLPPGESHTMAAVISVRSGLEPST